MYSWLTEARLLTDPDISPQHSSMPLSDVPVKCNDLRVAPANGRGATTMSYAA
jgi:hypothetical protein